MHDELWAELGMWDYVRFARDGMTNRVLYYGKPMRVLEQYMLFQEVLKDCQALNAAYGLRADPFFLRAVDIVTERVRTLGKPLTIWQMQELVRQENLNRDYLI
jgi:hypothetical protein